MNQIVDILKKLDVPQGLTLVAAPPSNRATTSTSSSVLRPSVKATDPHSSLSPSPDPAYPLNQRHYKPKISDVIRYKGPDRVIEYQA